LLGPRTAMLGKGPADHGYFVAGVETWAGLAVLVDLVGHGVAVGDAEAEVIEEVGDAGEEADAHDGVVGGFVDEGADELAAGAKAFGFGLDDDGADFGEVWAVEMERAAAEELVAIVGWLGVDAEGMVFVDGGRGDEALGDGEVADVFAELGVVATEEGAVAGE